VIGLAGGRARSAPLFAAFFVAVACGIGIAAAFALDGFKGKSESLALPELHGQAAWAAGARVAPGFDLRDQRGAVVSLAGLRGRTVLLAFLGAHCPVSCGVEATQLAWIMRGLPAAERPVLLIVSADPNDETPAEAARQARSSRIAGDWTWHWLSGGEPELSRVWRAYEPTASTERSRRGAVALIDARGFERTAYLFPFQPAFVQSDLLSLAR
jgi:cytochrome oxidase Cu insertion factor (SCO1/SenC/PrrC family)